MSATSARSSGCRAPRRRAVTAGGAPSAARRSQTRSRAAAPRSVCGARQRNITTASECSLTWRNLPGVHVHVKLPSADSCSDKTFFSLACCFPTHSRDVQEARLARFFLLPKGELRSLNFKERYFLCSFLQTKARKTGGSVEQHEPPRRSEKASSSRGTIWAKSRSRMTHDKGIPNVYRFGLRS